MMNNRRYNPNPVRMLRFELVLINLRGFTGSLLIRSDPLFLTALNARLQLINTLQKKPFIPFFSADGSVFHRQLFARDVGWRWPSEPQHFRVPKTSCCRGSFLTPTYRVWSNMVSEIYIDPGPLHLLLFISSLDSPDRFVEVARPPAMAQRRTASPMVSCRSRAGSSPSRFLRQN